MIIQSLFSKAMDQLTEEDLTIFFTDPRTENNKLEFKSYKDFSATREKGSKAEKDTDAFKNILTTICAFLNTDGGVLIWGAPEGKIISGNEKVFTGSLTGVKSSFGKDQIINKIVSSINPTPNRIFFAAIPVKSGGYVYIFEVIASDYAPHQINGTYYMRLDGQTKFAPHQYIDALIRRVQTPRLQMQFKFGEITRVNNLVMIPFNLTLWNSSRQINEKNVTLRLSSIAQILKENEMFDDYHEGTNLNIKVAEVMHHGNPVRYTFFLITTMYFGYCRRRIPVNAMLFGDTAPMVFSYFNIEFLFTDTLQISYTLLSAKENTYANDLELAEELKFAEARLDYGFTDFVSSTSHLNMKKWKP